MNSDDWFEDFDDTALQEIDAIEAAALSKTGNSSSSMGGQAGPSVSDSRSSVRPTSTVKGDSSFDITFDIDENDLQQLDRHVASLRENSTRPVLNRVNSTSNTRQTTLGGGFVTSPKKPPSSQSRSQRAKPSSKSNGVGRMASKTKKWDHTEFAKTGLRPSKKSKGKRKAVDPDGWDEEEEEEFDQFPAPFIPTLQSSIIKTEIAKQNLIYIVLSPPPMKLVPDLLEAKHWLYPLNKPKRDYQFNIVKHCLFENTLVALPTGLGKTFIAGSVMLNYYRWFPNGKVVFVAPTKPLVAQQISACHKVCGIPGTDAVELTGAVLRPIRAQYWKEKRVFYMTPQTLRNDLVEDICDAKDIILLVIDEAHRATGGYAYNQVVQHLMAKNPHFRIVALTATPGGNPEAVQNLIDGLHISHVEIRDENSIDIRPYLHEKSIEQHVLSMNDDINQVMELLVKAMEPLVQQLKQHGIFVGNNLMKMHPYAAQARQRELRPHQKWAFLPLTKLATLARAMGYLLEGTMGMCYNYLHGLIAEEEAPATPSKEDDSSPKSKQKKSAAPKQRKVKIKWRNDSNFMAVMTELESQRSRGSQMHPKMDLLKELLVNYFEKRKEEDENESEEGGPSKAMVFVTYREAIDDIVQMLDAYQPLIRASRFVGQGLDKQGTKGMAQKKQLEIIRQFQSNEYNVLVATSVGEEGLDIGEVDFIVCYDAQKTPIRMLQRMGRTGRQRHGIVHVLLAEAREEFNMEQAKASYKEVQKAIWRGTQFELYGDVERLLPEHIKPQCMEKEMEIKPYVPEQPYNKNADKDNVKGTKTKRKRNDDIGRYFPAGASAGFVRASELSVKGVKKRKTTASQSSKAKEKDFDEQGVDDDTDKDLESGLIIPTQRMTKSSSLPKPKAERKPRLRKAATLDGGTKRTTARKASLLSQLGEDDSDDMEIERTIPLASSPKSNQRERASGEESGPSQTPPVKRAGLDGFTPSPVETIDLCNIDSDVEIDNKPSSPSPLPPTDQSADQDLSWLVADDDEMNIRIASSSPIAAKNKPGPSHKDVELDESIQIIEDMDFPPPAKPATQVEGHSIHESTDKAPDSPVVQHRGKIRTDMPPPHLPARLIPCQSPDAPVATFPVKKAGQIGTKNLPLDVDGYSSPTEEIPLKRLQRHQSTSTPIRKKKRKGKLTALEAQHNPIFDVAADHSGDEVSEGASNGEDDTESETDRMFIRDSPLTQMPNSYDQSLVYRQSLLSQASAGVDMPQFANAPPKSTLFYPRRGPRPVNPSSSPTRGEDGSDDYEFGSFVVPDDVV